MRFWLVVTILVVLLMVMSALALALGAVSIPFSTTLSLVLQPWKLWQGQHSSSQLILVQLRLPRILLGILAGSGLAMCGGVMQGLFRNPLADPYLLGIASGASTGAALCIVLGWRSSPLMLTLFAFGGGLLAVFLVMQVARSRWGQLSPITLILAGVAMSSMFSAVTSFLIFFTGREEREQIVFWLMGDLGHSTWQQLGLLAPLTLLAAGGILWFVRDLNALALGEDMATHLGLNPQRSQGWLLFWSTLLTAGIVGICGTIGFVGLLIPHGVRLVIGPDHRRLLPLSFLGGAVFLVGCDLLARLLARPSELPIGLMTALFGAPFFLFLLRRHQRHGGSW